MPSAIRRPEGNQGLLYKSPDTGFDREITVVFTTDGTVLCGVGDGFTLPFLKTEGATDYYDENWHSIVTIKIYDASGDILDLFVDGEAHASNSSTFNAVQNSADFETGRISPISSPERYYNGAMDEIRVIRTAVSSNWAATHHKVQSSNGSFWDVEKTEKV